jgi:hypothetical protein
VIAIADTPSLKASRRPSPPLAGSSSSWSAMRLFSSVLLGVDPARPSAAQARDLLAAVAVGRVDQNATPTRAADGRRPTAGLRATAGSGRRFGPPEPAAALLGLLLGVLVLSAGTTVIALTSGSVGAAAALPAARTSTAATVTSPAAASPASSHLPRRHRYRLPCPRAVPRRIRRLALPQRPLRAPVAAEASRTEPVTFIQRYYAQLSGKTDAAFALLGPRARGQAGGVDRFKGFYARMQSVTLQKPRPIGDNAVTAVVRFVQKDGTSNNEPYRFVMTTDSSGRLIMESFSRA